MICGMTDQQRRLLALVIVTTLGAFLADRSEAIEYRSLTGAGNNLATPN